MRKRWSGDDTRCIVFSMQASLCDSLSHLVLGMFFFRLTFVNAGCIAQTHRLIISPPNRLHTESNHNHKLDIYTFSMHYSPYTMHYISLQWQWHFMHTNMVILLTNWKMSTNIEWIMLVEHYLIDCIFIAAICIQCHDNFALCIPLSSYSNTKSSIFVLKMVLCIQLKTISKFLAKNT